MPNAWVHDLNWWVSHSLWLSLIFVFTGIFDRGDVTFSFVIKKRLFKFAINLIDNMIIVIVYFDVRMTISTI